MVSNSSKLFTGSWILFVLASVAKTAGADECTSMVPYLREVRESSRSSDSNMSASAAYSNMLLDLVQRGESESSEVRVEALGHGSAGGKTSKTKSELEYHVANSQSATATASQSREWLSRQSNTIAASAVPLMSQCFNRRGLDYSFALGADGNAIYIKATFRTPTPEFPSVSVRQVEHGKNVTCFTESFISKPIDAGTRILRCVRKNDGGDTITISTNFHGGEDATFYVPDNRPRFLEKTVDLNLTWCGFPECAEDPMRQLAWSPLSKIRELQGPEATLSCSLFDLLSLGLIRSSDVLVRDQKFPLQLMDTIKGNWKSIRQDVARSVPISNRTIQLCGTRAEPFDEYWNLHFKVRTTVRYFERIVY